MVMRTAILSFSNKGNIPANLLLGNRPQNTVTGSKAMIDSRPHSVTRPDSKTPLMSSAVDPDPSMCESYLLSPLETILESLDDYDWEYISCHDITEAYDVLSMRIRAIAPSFMHSQKPPPSLLLLKEHAISLARALKRDIRRAMVDPSHNLKPSAPFESYLSEVSMTDYDIQHTIDLSTLCHFSLRVLSDIFAFRVLYLLFPVQDLNDLFHEVLKIASATELHTPNASKTVSLAFWIIQSQQLPSSVLEPQKVEIISALRDALNGQRGFQPKCDSLKAVNSLLKHQHALFTAPFLRFFLTILTNISVDEAECRLQACNALSGLVLTKFRSSDFPHEAISQEIHAFLKPQIPPRNYNALSREKFPLHYYLMMAYNSESNDTKEPLWAVITLASLIALSDRWLYTRVDFRFFAKSLFPAFGHKCKEVNQLAIAAWGGLVWAFTLLPANHPTWRLPEDPEIPDASLGMRGKAFRFLKGDLKAEKGVFLIRGLLLARNSGDDGAATLGDVSRALLVIKAMIAGTQAVDYEVGVKVLSMLVSAIGTSKSTGAEQDDISPNLEMFEGSLLEVGSCKVKDVAQRVSEIRPHRIRALSEAEVMHHWAALVETWVEAVERTLVPPVELPRGLLDAWQSLLLVKADLTQEHRDLTPSGALASQIAGIVTRFLVHSPDIPVQVQRLMVVNRLWNVMKNVFATSHLPAEKILASVLKVKFSLEDAHVKAAWSDVCADLISVGIPTLLHVISNGSEGQTVTRQLWTVLAKAWQVPDGEAHWEELVSFLVIPFRSWVMLGTEIELWEGVLRSSMSIAHSHSVESLRVVDRFLRRLGNQATDALVAFPQGIAALMGYVDLSTHTGLPQSFITIIDRTLVLNYPPRAELLAACLEIIRHLGKLIAAVPRGMLVQFLCGVEKGICRWIGDEKATMLTREHDIVVQEVYCTTLELLRELPPSLETLVTISPFLSSAFGRLSSSAIGPLTFHEFWRATYHGIKEYQSSYPDCLRACLLGYSDAFGGSIAEGLSMSQGIGSLSIPDSQPFYLDRQEAWLSHEKSPLAKSPFSPRTHEHTSPDLPMKRRRLDGPSSLNPKTSPVLANEVNADHEQGVECIPLSTRPPLATQSMSGGSLFGLSTPRSTPLSGPPKESISQKHSAVEISHERRYKRPKTESNLDLDQPVPQNMSGDQPGQRLSGPGPPQFSSFPPSDAPELLPKDSHPHHVHPSPEVPYSVLSQSESYSQHTDTRKRKRVSDWVNSFRNLQNSGPQGSASQVSLSEPSSPRRRGAVTRASTPSLEEQEEYDTWEAGAASLQEIMELQKELVGSDNFVPETDEEELEAEAEHDSDLDNFLGGSQLVISGSKLEPDHEQTIPKRSESTPLGRTRTFVSRR